MLTPIQPIGNRNWTAEGTNAPRRPKAARESTIMLTPVRWPITQKRPKIAQPSALPTAITTIVSTRLNPSVMPSVPSTQLIGAMFAPIQIQNWSPTDDVRSRAGTGSTPCTSKLLSMAPSSEL